MMTRITESIMMIFKQFALQIKFIVKNKASFLSVISFIFFGTILDVIFVPFSYAGAIKIGFEVTIPLLLILGGLSYTWKRSTLFKNESTTKANRNTYYISLIITLFLIGNILSWIMILIDWVTVNLGLVLSSWAFMSGDREELFNLSLVNMPSLIYIFNMNILLTFSFYFLIHRFFTNQKNYFIAVLIISILIIIFGGSLNSYFASSRNIDNTGGALPGELGFHRFRATLFPESMFIPSLFLPFFSTGEYFQMVYSVVVTHHYSEHNVYLFYIGFSKAALPWTMVMIMPWVYTIVFGISGTLISRVKRG